MCVYIPHGSFCSLIVPRTLVRFCQFVHGMIERNIIKTTTSFGFVNHRFNQLKHKARQRLLSERGLYHRSKRPVDVEPVFANIKHNKNFKRFLLKGIDKTEIEWGLLCIAHNLKKIAA